MNLKLLLLVVGCICFTNWAFAQDSLKTRLSLSVGPAFPVGKFGGEDVEWGDWDGLAVTGYHVILEAARYIKPRWGGMVALRYSRLPREAAHSLSLFAPPELIPSFSATTVPYQLYSFMAGPFYDVMERDKITLQVAVLGGATSVSYPRTFYKYHGDSFFELLYVADPVIEFTYTLKSSARYRLSGRLDLFLNLGFYAHQSHTYCALEGLVEQDRLHSQQ
ncbi:MAG: hypothetical protein HRU69_14695 [Flammeovirgaceae bacterium]|nr:MAG: hypothetical protein HRU69_14695 [Flammeovirgaceae bacterium]